MRAETPEGVGRRRVESLMGNESPCARRPRFVFRDISPRYPKRRQTSLSKRCGERGCPPRKRQPPIRHCHGGETSAVQRYDTDRCAEMPIVMRRGEFVPEGMVAFQQQARARRNAPSRRIVSGQLRGGECQTRGDDSLESKRAVRDLPSVFPDQTSRASISNEETTD